MEECWGIYQCVLKTSAYPLLHLSHLLHRSISLSIYLFHHNQFHLHALTSQLRQRRTNSSDGQSRAFQLHILPLAYLTSAVFTLSLLPYASAVMLSNGGAPGGGQPPSAAHRSSPSHQLPIVSELGGEIYRAPAAPPGCPSMGKPKCSGLLSGDHFPPPYTSLNVISIIFTLSTCLL